MKFELLQIKNALCSLSNELELAPEVQNHLVPISIWKTWASSVRDRALREFLLGHPPLLTSYDVSSDGTTVSLKKFSKLALKPGTFQRKRKPSKSSIINRNYGQLAQEYEYLIF